MGRRNNYIDEHPLASVSAGINTVSSNVVIRGYDGLAVIAKYTAEAPGADVIASSAYVVATNLVTSVAHGYRTGLLGAFTTSGGDQPAGLTETNYYIIALNAASYQYAPNASAAEDGVFMPFTDQGSGNHTFTPDAANVSIQYRGALKETGPFVTISSTNVTTSDKTILLNIDKPHYKVARVDFIVNAGQGTFQVDTSKESD